MPGTISDGGVIVMRSGECVAITPQNCQGVAKGVCQSLHLSHKAGVCHCDIRASNIVKFGDEFQLIDYDKAISTGDKFIFQSGALYDNRGDRLQQWEVGKEVHWEPSDDYEMLLKFILKCIAPPASASPSTPPRLSQK